MCDFNKIWCVFGLKCGDCTHQFSSKSDHFLALFWLWITNRRHTQPQIFMIFFTYWNMKIDRVLKKLRTPIMWLSLLCRLNFRVWPHTYMGALGPKIWYTVYYLAKRSYGAKFKQNSKNCPSGRFYDMENLSVKTKLNLIKENFVTSFFVILFFFHFRRGACRNPK